MEAKYTDEQLIQIAKIVDNGFIGKETTGVLHFKGSAIINTRQCDDVSIVTITFDDTGNISTVSRTGPDYSGYVTYKTSVKIHEYCLTLTTAKL